jgi:sugar phosphate isomerase/epimerase
VKIAVSSTPWSVHIHAGNLTQLEWLEAAASRLDVDGVVFVARDLPRADPEYAAQVKKVATDLGLTPVALDEPGLLDPALSDDTRTAAVQLAASLGVALLRTTAGPPGEIPPKTFAQTVAAAKQLAGAAKAANITVVVAPAAGAIVANLADVRHLLKDADSAWLRYALPAGTERSEMSARERVLLTELTLASDPNTMSADRTWVVIDGATPSGVDPFAAVGTLVSALRAR